jgi:hypothetical protein
MEDAKKALAEAKKILKEEQHELLVGFLKSKLSEIEKYEEKIAELKSEIEKAQKYGLKKNYKEGEYISYSNITTTTDTGGWTALN